MPIFEKIRVYVLSRQPVFRHGLVQGLARQHRLAVIGESADLDSSGLPEGTCILLTDLSSGIRREIALIKSLKKQSEKTKIVILASSEEAVSTYSAMQAGADFYISKSLTVAGIASALKKIYSGGRPAADPKLDALVWSHGQKKKTRLDNSLKGLSQEENEILAMVSKGFTNKELALTLEVSERTVRRHLTSIYRKLGVKNRTAAIAKALTRPG